MVVSSLPSQAPLPAAGTSWIFLVFCHAHSFSLAPFEARQRLQRERATGLHLSTLCGV
ncbi:hypothetical protein OH76DRAFT_497142 [Lentinus brumalis]|uniref:Uncharacterized protein n=1 Tax=Lentinus brumalis TaxID=2498619 RepID=A0A371DBJ0_9APHY|nr:hypothetical protein OH76DRAFT_497142 [Polyporus brumalis]